jgi:hypothetical protein
MEISCVKEVAVMGKKDAITLKFTNYYVTGVADLSLWGGGNAAIVMEPFTVENPNKSTLLKNLNDSGFGVESINGAVCDIYKNYEGHNVFLKGEIIVGKVSEYTKKTYKEWR